MEENDIKSMTYAWRRIAHKDKKRRWILNSQVRETITRWYAETKTEKEILLTAYSEEPFTISATDIEKFVDKYNEIVSRNNQVSNIFNESFEKYLYLNSMEDIDKYRDEIFEYGWQCIKNLMIAILSIQNDGVPIFIIDKIGNKKFDEEVADILIKSISDIYNEIGKINKYEADLFAIKLRYKKIRTNPKIIPHLELHQIKLYKESVLSTYEGLLRTLSPSDIWETSKARLNREIKRIINKGESAKIEFKSSLRWDYKKNEKNRELEKEVVKALAGFLNTDGGILFIGINDDGDATGIEKDIFTFSKEKQNWDSFQQTLVNIIDEYIGIYLTPYLEINPCFLKGKLIAMIKVGKSPYPVYFKDGQKKRFYIRSGNTTRELTGEDLQKYIDSRFNQMSKQ